MAGAVAVIAAIVSRVLSGPAEHPVILPQDTGDQVQPAAAELRMGLQAAAAALVMVALNLWIGLEHSAWAITASTYTISGSLGNAALARLGNGARRRPRLAGSARALADPAGRRPAMNRASGSAQKIQNRLEKILR